MGADVGIVAGLVSLVHFPHVSDRSVISVHIRDPDGNLVELQQAAPKVGRSQPTLKLQALGDSRIEERCRAVEPTHSVPSVFDLMAASMFQNDGSVRALA